MLNQSITLKSLSFQSYLLNWYFRKLVDLIKATLMKLVRKVKGSGK